MKKQKFRSFWPLLAAFLVGVLACMAFVIWCLGGFSVFPSVAKYAAVLKLVNQSYIGEADPAALTDTALDAALGTLDRWSYYLTSEEYEAYENFSNNRYAGIGVTVRKDEQSGGFAILDLTKDGPAARAGVQIGEIITASNGTDVTGATTDELKALIEAAYGDTVTLTLLSPDGTARELAVTCEHIAVDPVSWQCMDDNIGYIRLENFELGMADSAIAAVDALVEQGVDGIVFDVRANPGGRVTELCELLDHLVPQGELFIRANKAGREAVETSDDEWVELPLAVVVNSESYSAAEFFAAALREYERAAIVGEATTGKSRSQVTYVLRDGSAVHLSRFRYLTPNRVDLSEVGGLVPDVEVALSDEQKSLFAAGALDPADDAQIQAAAATLRP